MATPAISAPTREVEGEVIWARRGCVCKVSRSRHEAAWWLREQRRGVHALRVAALRRQAERADRLRALAAVLGLQRDVDAHRALPPVAVLEHERAARLVPLDGDGVLAWRLGGRRHVGKGPRLAQARAEDARGALRIGGLGVRGALEQQPPLGLLRARLAQEVADVGQLQPRLASGAPCAGTRARGALGCRKASSISSLPIWPGSSLNVAR